MVLKYLRSKKIYLVLFIICISNVIVTAYISYTRDLFSDELATYTITNSLSVLENVITKYEGNMWIYYIFTYLWRTIFGSSEIAIRSISVLFSILTIISVFALSARIFSTKSGVLSAFLLATNLFFIKNSSFARSYSMTIFFVSLYLWGINNYKKKFFWKVLTISLIPLMIFTHVYTIFILITGAILLVSFEKINKFSILYLFALALSILVLLLIPSSKSQVMWIQKPEILNLLGVPVIFSGDSFVVSVIFSFLIFLLLYRLVKNLFSIRRKSVYILGAYVVIPILLSYIFSIFYKPIFILQYQYFSLLPFIIILGESFANISSKKTLSFLLLIVVIASSLRLSEYIIQKKQTYYTILNQTEPWNDIAKMIKNKYHSKDIYILFPMYNEPTLAYHLHKHGVVNIEDSKIYSARLVTGNQSTYRLDLIDQLEKKHNRVWLLVNKKSVNTNDHEAKIYNILENKYNLIERYSYYNASLFLYEKIYL